VTGPQVTPNQNPTGAPVPRDMAHRPEPIAVRFVLICHSCRDAWEPDLSDPALLSAGVTGCRRCGGWTWLGEITEPEREAAPAPVAASATGVSS
jgi:hypothetical protein